jgi:hypothetical protein
VPVGIGGTFDFGNEEDDEQPDAIIAPQMTAAITAGIRQLDIPLTLVVPRINSMNMDHAAFVLAS